MLAVGADGIVVAAGDGALRVEELQLEGKRRMRVAEFLKGHAIKAGDLLGNLGEVKR